MRPELNREIDPEEFILYYWLKEELISFCKSLSLPATGGKREITSRIYSYLKDGIVIKSKTKKKVVKATPGILALDALIPTSYKNDEAHRAFFKEVIGEHFKFNVKFMNWMRENPGKTYSEAVDVWYHIKKDKNSGSKTEISPQFEYNQYTRDFFKNNPGLKREECIRCWKYKKSLPGHNRYEDEDLNCLYQ